MRPFPFALLIAVGLAVPAAYVLAAGAPSGSHAAGIPSTGSQSGFGRTGNNNPVSAGMGTSGATGNVAAPNSTISSPESASPGGINTVGTSPGTGLSSGVGSVNDANANANESYPITPVEAGGTSAQNSNNGTGGANGSAAGGGNGANGGHAAANSITGNSANSVARQMGYYQGRWWYPMGKGHWVYWDNPSKSWILFSGADTNLLNNANMRSRYSSGYRGLSNFANANGNANAGGRGNVSANMNTSAAGNASHWYFRSGQWLWFNGQTFQPAQ